MVVAGYLMLTSHLKKKPDLLNTSLCRVLVCHQAVYTDVSISAGASKTKSLWIIAQTVWYCENDALYNLGRIDFRSV